MYLSRPASSIKKVTHWTRLKNRIPRITVHLTNKSQLMMVHLPLSHLKVNTYLQWAKMIKKERIGNHWTHHQRKTFKGKGCILQSRGDCYLLICILIKLIQHLWKPIAENLLQLILIKLIRCLLMPMSGNLLQLIQEGREKGYLSLCQHRGHMGPSLSLGQLTWTDFLQGAVPAVWVLWKSLGKVFPVKSVIYYKMITK